LALLLAGLFYGNNLCLLRFVPPVLAGAQARPQPYLENIMRSLSPEDVEAISEQVANRLFRVDAETHEEHHDWIKEKIAAEVERRRSRRRILESALIWALPLALVFVGTALWESVKKLASSP